MDQIKKKLKLILEGINVCFILKNSTVHILFLFAILSY